MIAILYKALEWLAKGGVQAFMVQAGLSVVVFSGLDLLIEELMENALVSLSSSGFDDVLNLALLGGLGEFISILGSALLTRVAIVTASNIAGISKVA